MSDEAPRPIVRVPPTPPVLTGRPMSQLAEPFLTWLAFSRRRSEHTVRAYAADLATFLAFASEAGLTYPADVRPQHVEFHVSRLMEQGRGASTANRQLAAIRSWWKWMVYREITAANPAAACYTVPQPKRLPKYLHEHEQIKVLTVLEARTGLVAQRDHALIATGLLAGLRCDELAKLRMSDVSLEAGVLRVVRGKGDKERETPIAPGLASVLSRYLTETRPRIVERFAGWDLGPWLFTRASTHGSYRQAGEPLNPRSIWALVRRAITPIVGRDISPHCLRSSLATRLHARGGELATIQTILGHASPRTTMIYTHVASDRLRADMTRLLGQGARKAGRRPTAKAPAPATVPSAERKRGPMTARQKMDAARLRRTNS